MGNDTAAAAFETVLDNTEIAALVASIEHLPGVDTAAVIAALVPAVTAVVDQRRTEDRRSVLAEVEAFKAKVRRSMMRVQRETTRHADALVSAL